MKWIAIGFLSLSFNLFTFSGCTTTKVRAPFQTQNKSNGNMTDSLDKSIKMTMKKYKINGLSLAVVSGGEIVKIGAYGFADIDKKKPVTPATLFQAASISKPITALGALVLVEKGVISLDSNVNDYLSTWKVDDNKFTTINKVTLRRILCHSSGLNVHGFRGYEIGSSVPSLLQILNGKNPANNEAVTVVYTPGTKWQYSGGGYTVLQQMIIDTTKKDFAQYMNESVLNPLKMLNSTFKQPLPRKMKKHAATGYYRYKEVKRKFHVYPELAAAGLWTTPSDLAKVVIAIQESYQNIHNPIISHDMTKTMLTDYINGDGLGLFVGTNTKNDKVFIHGGRNEGFDSFLYGECTSGKGMVIFINKNENRGALKEIQQLIKDEYKF